MVGTIAYHLVRDLIAPGSGNAVGRHLSALSGFRGTERTTSFKGTSFSGSCIVWEH